MTDAPTKQQLKWAGRVWDAALRCDCEAFYWLAMRYHTGAETFGMHAWAEIGEANQIEIARNLLRIEGYFIKGHR
jgi:hypothetical protein